MAKNYRKKKSASEIKNKFDEFISRMDIAQEKFSESEDRTVEIIQKGKKKKQSKTKVENIVSAKNKYVSLNFVYMETQKHQKKRKWGEKNI